MNYLLPFWSYCQKSESTHEILTKFRCFWCFSPRDGVRRILKLPDYSNYTRIHNSWKFGENWSGSFWEQTVNKKIKLDYIPLMRYGIGTLRNNQRTRLCLIRINCVWEKSVYNEALVVWPSRDFRRDMTWHDVTWHDVTWRRDVPWRHMTWRHMTWHYVAWHDVTWRDITWHDVTWRDLTWHDVTWREITWHYVTWRDMTWHNVAWRDITWHDNKFDSKALVVWPSRDFRATVYKFRAFLSRNECVTSKTSWTRRWPEFLRSSNQNICLIRQNFLVNKSIYLSIIVAQ